MLFIRMLNFIKGYLIITVSGRFTERFINICVRRGFSIWDVKSRNGVITARITVSDFLKLRDVARITRVRVRIEERRGIGFIIKRYRRRWPLIIAGMIFIAIMYYTATHVMSIEISGNERVSTDRIMAELGEAGLRVGAEADEIDSDMIRNKVMIADEEVSWVGINVRGSRVYVEIAERIDVDKIPREGEEPCNVVAKKDGVIEELRVKQGQTMVRRGGGVRQGDVLISGIVDSVYGGFRTVHAYGEVWARTEYTLERDYALKYTEREYTDNVKKFFAIDLLGKRIELFSRGHISPERFEEQISDYILRRSINGRDVEIGASEHKFVGYNLVERTRTVAEAVELGSRELTEEIEQTVPKDAKVVSKTTEHNIISGDTVRVTVTWYLSEDIAEEVPIDEGSIEDDPETPAPAQP